VRDERHRLPADPRGPLGGGAQRHGAQHLGNDDPHLEGGEGGTQAPPDAAAEGKPAERRGRLADEPVRAKRGGVRVEVLASLDEVDVRARDRSGRNGVPADPDGLAHAPIHERDHRPDPQRLHDRGVQVLRRTTVQLTDQAAQHPRMVQQQIEGPGQRRCRRLVSGEQQGHELVAYLVVGHSAALVVPREQQLGQDVAAPLQIGRLTPLPDLRDEHRVERIPGPDEPRPRGVRPELAVARGEEQQGIPAEAGHRADVAAQLVLACAGIDTEDDPHDDVEGDRLHARAQRERLAGRPAGDLRPRDVADGGFPGTHAITVERGQDQLALAQVLRPVQHEDRMRADQGLEDRGVGLPGAEHVIVAAEDGLHQLGAADMDHVHAERKAHGEHVAVGP